MPLAALLTMLLALSLQGATAATPDRAQLERRLQSSELLIEQSSGAKQVERSAAPAALAQRRQARETHQQAAAALAAGQLDRAAALLDQASREMVAAVRLAAPEQVTGDKQRSDFDHRLAAARTLLEAQQRIAAEKGAGPRGREVSQRIEALLVEAQSRAAAGQLDEGRRLLDQAYGAARAAIGGLREGETMVRSLHFANKAEEYDYELDRNDTHRMLVQVLLKDRRRDAAVESAQQAATQLRQQAEGQAARGEHEAAVKTLEAATRELVKAIRAAGVYIPG